MNKQSARFLIVSLLLAGFALWASWDKSDEQALFLVLTPSNLSDVESIESDLTRPLERDLSLVQAVEGVSAGSVPGFSIVLLTLANQKPETLERIAHLSERIAGRTRHDRIMLEPHIAEVMDEQMLHAVFFWDRSAGPDGLRRAADAVAARIVDNGFSVSNVQLQPVSNQIVRRDVSNRLLLINSVRDGSEFNAVVEPAIRQIDQTIGIFTLEGLRIRFPK